MPPDLTEDDKIAGEKNIDVDWCPVMVPPCSYLIGDTSFQPCTAS
jgi:hypothetical protein